MSLKNAYDNLRLKFDGPREALIHYGFDVEGDDLNDTLSEVLTDSAFDIGASVGLAFLLGYASAADDSLHKEPEWPDEDADEKDNGEREDTELNDTELNDTELNDTDVPPASDEPDAPEAGDEAGPAEQS